MAQFSTSLFYLTLYKTDNVDQAQYIYILNKNSFTGNSIFHECSRGGGTFLYQIIVTMARYEGTGITLYIGLELPDIMDIQTTQIKRNYQL